MRKFSMTKFFAVALLSGISLHSDLTIARTISPFPSNLASANRFRGDIGGVYYFYVTGSTDGGLWGTDIYTDDSSVAKAAVHAGILKPNQQGVVKVTILAGQSSYRATVANGIKSTAYGAYAGSFSVAADDGGENKILSISNLNEFRSCIGCVYQFTVRGNTDSGSVWGTNYYTDDSALSKAAVHAGILGNNQTDTVRVVIVPEQKSYFGTNYNGVTSGNWGQYAGSYAIADVNGKKPLIPYPATKENPLANPGSLTVYNGRNGAALYFRVTGSTTGNIWGSGVYTTDSTLAVAAVHAGVLKAGQTGIVKVIIAPGQSSYQSSTANGITSNNWGSYGNSYKVAPADGDNGLIPDINSPASAKAQVGQLFSYQITAGDSPTNLNATGLPEGLNVDATGLISGKPKVTGHFTVALWASNSVGTDMAPLSLDIGQEVPTNTTLADCLFNWAEQVYPGYFSPPTRQTLTYPGGYTYRYYSETNVYLATNTDGNVYLLAPSLLGDKIVKAGTIAYFTNLSGCR